MKVGTMMSVFVAAMAAAAGTASAVNFTSTSLVVVRLGDGTGALSGAATPVFLDEYDLSGMLIQSIAMPTMVSGSHRRLTMSGTATSEGALTLSADRRYLTLGGYDANVGTASVATTSNTGGSAVNRVIGRVDMTGAVDTTTVITDAYSGANIRSVVTDDGTNIWSVGSNGGVRYSSFGGTTTTQVNSTGPTNNRNMNIFSGQLYVSSAQNTFNGVHTVGTGLPTGGGNSTALLNGFGTLTGASPYDYYFADADTLYIADDSATAGVNGIQKWTQSGGVWSRVMTFTAGLPAGARMRQLTGVTDAFGVTTLYSTTTNTSGSSLVKLIDTGAASTFTVLANAGTNQVFRGIDFAPIPSPGSISLLALAGLAMGRRRR